MRVTGSAEFVTGLLGVFVGLRVPAFLLLGKIVEDRERMRCERVG